MSERTNTSPQENPPSDRLVEHFFRHESANLIAVLSRAFGIGRIELIEDMVQAAMLEAMKSWSHNGVPSNPAGWIHQVAKNRVLDALRREQIHQRAMAFAGQESGDAERLVDSWLADEQLPDSLLRMIFVCCHPSLERQSQIALTLKILCGFGISEIARGLLISSESAKKKIQRAKQRLVQQNLTMELPSSEELQSRLSTVHDVLYLMFNEGYSPSRGNDPIRGDICEEAARLCHLLCTHDLATPTTQALLALMLFHGARFDSRVDGEGCAILLDAQDRDKWDRGLIRVGEAWLARSESGLVSRFHLEAAIALQHCRAASVESTDWNCIIALYDRLLQLSESPIYRLNRAIALAQIGDVANATAELDLIEQGSELDNYFLLHCSRARLHEVAGNRESAIAVYEQTLDLKIAEHERSFVVKRMESLRQPT